ncbi:MULTISPECIES: DUF6146 family protein [Bizionia]|uniref:Lipoprotein n=1 Tax=Bizionia algoritergicola TaxID=291187 RepID=A0A5D0QWS4_9FLAO|nr:MULTISPECIES: DUF6146 family protein [Bizionia]OBX24169.1 hypothetical protein BAA08_02215 [Bizionia sp. APA-3]TYB73683.1 hypothetical protein ES675_08505 [Bizionia algoritergicola]
MKSLCSILITLCLFASCKTPETVGNVSETAITETQDTIKLVNEELEYEVIIIEAGFDSWMARRAKPRSFYTQSFLEAKNIQYVTEWNNRVVSSRYNNNLYGMSINYQQGTDYGLELNYLLYHYFVFFQEKYKQKLSSHNPQF